MGAGPGGAYLYKLLKVKRPDIEVYIFDPPHETKCGIKSCGWATSRPETLSRLCHDVGAKVPLLANYDHVTLVMNGKKIRIRSSIAMFNKSLLIKRLLGRRKPLNAWQVEPGEFDRVIDATGHDRAFLPPSRSESFWTVQRKCRGRFEEHLAFPFARGWAWVMPLGGGEAHVGAGAIDGLEEAEEMLRKAGLDRMETICACFSHIHRGGLREPFVDGKVWGLGEAIGLVDPLTGEGVIPAMISAKLLLENWDNPEHYERAIKETFGIFRQEVEMAEKLRQRRLFWPFVRTYTRIKPTLFQTLSLALRYLSYRSKP